MYTTKWIFVFSLHSGQRSDLKTVRLRFDPRRSNISRFAVSRSDKWTFRLQCPPFSQAGWAHDKNGRQNKSTAVNPLQALFTYPVTRVTIHILCMKEHNPTASSDQRLQFLLDVFNLPGGQCRTVIQLWLAVVQNNSCYVFESEIHSVYS